MQTKTASKTEILDHCQKRLRANYPSQWTKETDDLCRDVLREMYGEIGADRLTRTVDEMLKVEAFFNVASLRKHIVAPPAAGKKVCDACRSNAGFIFYLKPGTYDQSRWYVYTKPCKHDSQCLKCGDTGWAIKYGMPGSRPTDYEACNCIAGDKFQPRGVSVSDRKEMAAGQ